MFCRDDYLMHDNDDYNIYNHNCDNYLTLAIACEVFNFQLCRIIDIVSEWVLKYWLHPVRKNKYPLMRIIITCFPVGFVTLCGLLLQICLYFHPQHTLSVLTDLKASIVLVQLYIASDLKHNWYASQDWNWYFSFGYMYVLQYLMNLSIVCIMYYTSIVFLAVVSSSKWQPQLLNIPQFSKSTDYIWQTGSHFVSLYT